MTENLRTKGKIDCNGFGEVDQVLCGSKGLSIGVNFFLKLKWSTKHRSNETTTKYNQILHTSAASNLI